MNEVEEYLDDLQLERAEAETTIANKRSTLQQFSDWYDGAFEDINDRVVKRYSNHLEDEGYAHSTCKQKFYQVRTWLEWCVNKGLLETNPAAGIDADQRFQNPTKLVQHIPKEDRYLSVDECNTLLDACESDIEEVTLRLLINTGARAEELLQLRTGDVNAQDGSVRIQTLKVKVDDPYRTVPVNFKTKKCFQDWMQRGRLTYPYHADSDYLLLTQKAGKMSEGSLKTIVDRVAERAGLQYVIYTQQNGMERKYIHPHTFRRTYGVHRVKSDIGAGSLNLAFLAELMGHENIQTTKQNYLHFRTEDIADAERNSRPNI